MPIPSAKPTRSISLPTRLHPNSRKIEAKLNKLKSDWECSRATPLGSDAIQSGFGDLVQLYDSAKELTQKALLRRGSRKSVEETLDASLALLDGCGAARDLLLRTKESARSLHSSLRRKCVAGDCSRVESDINAYASFRKSARREVAKSLRALKTMEASIDQGFSASLMQEDDSLQTVIYVSRELSSVAISIFRCLYAFLCSHGTKTKAGTRWSLIANLLSLTVNSSDKELSIFNEVANVDLGVCSLQGQLRKNNSAKIDVVDVLKKRLEALNGCVDGLETVLERLFKCLIQHRVSLLNLITP